jgi:hypothetical protein
MGAEILGYRVYIRQLDLTYSEQLEYCDGSNLQSLTTQECTVPLSVLTASPYDLNLGNAVYVTVIAYNMYGDSETSPVGSGAVIQLVPDSPKNLQDLLDVTNSFRVGLSWEDGDSDGGSPVIDYRVSYD